MLALIPLFPLAGFIVNAVLYLTQMKKHGHEHPQDHSHQGNAAVIPGVLATLCIFASFLVSLFFFIELMSMGEHRIIEQILYPWITVGKFNIDLALRLDSLNALFLLVITGVGTLIHIYSIGYMSHDSAPGKFFAYLNLFCFAMLMLVLGASLPILFLGWEGVGLCSYLLIGFWYQDIEKAKAGKKAFVVNRIGDFGFLLGMFFIYSAFGTLDFALLQQAVLQMGVSTEIVTTICLLLFLGCMGKSAQIPLYVWLPDAMAGPTPVSALIHAATMVTSGIYLVTRLNFLFSLSETAMGLIACTGAFTAFFAATIALAQRDIKKVLAYSTVSQLGYMFLACGVGAYTAAVFHVITHAFFKALLFLGAGSVIHGMHEEQDIFKMGGLSRSMPKTYSTFFMGWLAICGVAPFAGFFSKDEILWNVFSSPHGSFLLWGMGAATAVLTAFYMTRLFVLTFLGQSRFPTSVQVHESSRFMTVPLQILALLSLVGGLIGIPHMSWIEHWLEPIIVHGAGHESQVPHGIEWVLMGVSLTGALCGILGGWKAYSNLKLIASLHTRFQSMHKLLENKWYVDEFYETCLVRPIRVISEFLWKTVDVAVIDRVVIGFGKTSLWVGQRGRMIQTGSVQVYAFFILLGLIAIAGFLIYGRV